MSGFRVTTALLIAAPLVALTACSDPASTQTAAPAAQVNSTPTGSARTTPPTTRTTPATTTTTPTVRRTTKPVSTSSPKSATDTTWPSHFTELPNGIYCGDIVEMAVQDTSFTFQPWTYRSKVGGKVVQQNRKTVLLGLAENPVIEMPKAGNPDVLQDVVPLLGLRQAMQLTGAWHVASFDLQVVNHDVVRISQQDESGNYEGHCS